MSQVHPGFECSIVEQDGRTTLVCRGVVQPIPISDRYAVRIEYVIGKRPRIYVESPQLKPLQPNEKVPHTYAPNELCLYRWEFKADQPLATTIIPWMLHWLVFYESWRVTGVWQGGGEHPDIPPHLLDELGG